MANFSTSTRGRAWFGTIHITNMENAGLTKEQYEKPEYLADFFVKLWENSGINRKAGIAVCVSLDGCYHAHIACYGNTTTLKKVSEVLFNAHIEPQLGGKAELTDYIEKKGKYAEKGEQVLYTMGLEAIEEKQGHRSDLDEIEELLEAGATPNEILNSNIRFYKYEKAIKSTYFNKRLKETPIYKKMYCEYHWGESGTGKSHSYIKLCEEYGEDNIYLMNDYANIDSSGGGFDGYSEKASDVLFMDEFKGNMRYTTLLTILDKNSRSQIHCRYKNINCLWTKVYVCSIYPPEMVYRLMVNEENRCIDSFKQLMRRFNMIVYHYINDNGDYCSYSLPAKEYKNDKDMIVNAMRIEEAKKDPETKEFIETLGMYKIFDIIEPL